MSPSSNHDTQLLKGVLVLVLLRLLSERESYGYELVLRTREAGLTEVAEGSVYPALSRLESSGYVIARKAANVSGPPRKYLRLSEEGRQFLEDRTQAWRSLVHVLDSVLSDAPREQQKEEVP